MGALDLKPLQRDVNSVPIQGTFTTIVDGARVTVTTPGTAVQLTATSSVVKLIMVQALFSNTKAIQVGTSAVLATAGSEKGIQLEPGATMTLPINDPSLVYIDALVGTEGVTYQTYA